MVKNMSEMTLRNNSGIRYALGIDGGGTKTALMLTDADGTVCRTLTVDGCNPMDIGLARTVKLLRNAIDEICEGIPMSEVAMFAGIAGGGSASARKELNDFFSIFEFGAFDNHGDTYINRYYNETQNKQIDIMCCKESKYIDTSIYASVGLNTFDGGIKSDDTSVRIELIGIAPADSDYMGNVIASTSFEIIENGSFEYGNIIQNVVSAYIPNANTKHVVLVAPVYWDQYTPYSENEISVSWLLLLPITDDEMQFINTNGIDAFEKKLSTSTLDILVMNRESIV